MLQPDLPIVIPLTTGVAFWLLVGICPDNWPWRPPRPGPPPPPWWSKILGGLAAVASGLVFTGLDGIRASSSTPLVELAATGVFAFAGAYAARSLAAGLSRAPQAEVGLEGAAAFRR